MPGMYPKYVKLVLGALVAIALASCGRGGGAGNGGVTIPGMSTASVSGTVLGGTIVAVDATLNTEVRRAALPGNGTGRVSFSMPLPAGKSYKIYLIENEGTVDARTYSLYQGSVNTFSISSTIDIDFGFINTATGVAIPANDVTKLKGVASLGEDKTIPASLSGPVFAGADLQGNWQVLQMVCGGASLWVRGAIAIDAGGNTPSSSYISSSGSGTTAAAKYSITPSGVVTMQSGLTNIFSGMMASDKSMIVGTSSPEAGNFALVIMLKSGNTYSAADLQGLWKYSQLVAGANPAWARGDASIDVNGTISITNAASSAGIGGTPPDTLSGAFAIDPSGIVTTSAIPGFYGIMSADKGLLFAVTTNSDGSPSLVIFTRDKGIVFSGDDLRRIWRANWLSATSSASGTSYWGRAFYNVDNGSSYLQSIQQSFGTSPDVDVTTEMLANGKVSFIGTDFSGFISPRKNFFVGTMTAGSNNFTFYTFIR